MDLQGWWLPLGVVLAVLAILLLRNATKSNGKGSLPPTPPGAWPVLGHLPLLRTNTHRALLNLAKKHGPLIHLRFGQVPVVVVSSADMMRQFFHENDVTMAGRPFVSGTEIFGFNGEDLVGRQYGEDWRKLRRLFSQELLSPKRLNDFQSLRRKEVLYAVECISFQAQRSHDSSANMRLLLRDLCCNITTQMAASKRFLDTKIDPLDHSRTFSALLQDMTNAGAKFVVGDFIPLFKSFDFGGARRGMFAVRDRLTHILDDLARERRQDKEHAKAGVKDFLDTLLELQDQNQISQNVYRGLMGDIIVGATESPAAAIEWLLADLVANPDAMARAQGELDGVVGREQIVKESNIPSLKYLQACLKESLRLHPAVPLGFPHQSTASCTVAGYHIPAGTQVIVNMGAIHWNPDTYADPLRFDPGRFLGSGPNAEFDVRGQHFDLVPFGAGRRICAGLNMAMGMMLLSSAVLLQSFDWQVPVGSRGLDLTPGTGAVCSMLTPLELVPSPRLPAHVYAAENILLS